MFFSGLLLSAADAEVKYDSDVLTLTELEIDTIRWPYTWPVVVLNFHCLLRFISVLVLYFKFKKEAQTVNYSNLTV